MPVRKKTSKVGAERTLNPQRVRASEPKQISPTAFMRALRPENYSDTEDQALYILDGPILDHHLDTITNRNQTHDFELFARKLCERTICPNLRPQTGPEGGGDSKADSESYPVADEISRVYIGEANSGRERWAFAFSAKKTWTEKVRGDVEGIVATGRGYDRIVCVTSRFARAKDRARIEDELSKEHGIPVTVHDRSWIMKEVIENDRKDIAFNYLGVGDVKSDPLHLGPADYSRTRQLRAIEKSLDDPEAFRGMERQRATEALVAAKLSRYLERPRPETDGRFIRAIRLADTDGNYKQKLEARYEHIWTGCLWFDDIEGVNKAYDDFEKMALKTSHSSNLVFLSNLLQLLVNAVIYGQFSRGHVKFDKRTARLRVALEAIVADKNRPNNSLEAETWLLVLRLNIVMIDHKPQDLPQIWRDCGNILDRAGGLGEFKAERLVSMIGVVGTIAGNDADYNALIEKLALFVSERTSEAKGALILLKRAQQLEATDRIDMIRLLGKAAIGLSKREYAEELIVTLRLLMQAYGIAGLLWSARATCVMAIATIVMEGEESNIVPVSFVPTVKLWAWYSLELGHLPDFFLALQLLNWALNSLPLADESKERVQLDLQQLDFALGGIFLNVADTELAKLAGLPDTLKRFGLFTARRALLYTLGYEPLLRTEGTISEKDTDERVIEFFSLLKSQPVARKTLSPLILSEESGPTNLFATILGMSVEITFQDTDRLTLVAESILGSLEAFFATAIDQTIRAHTEKFKIHLVECADIAIPKIETRKLDMAATITWPAALSPTGFQELPEVREFLAKAATYVLDATCVADNVEVFLNKLRDDEFVHQRIAMITATPVSYHRVAGRNLSRLSDWEPSEKDYPSQGSRPQIPFVDMDVPTGPRNVGDVKNNRRPDIKNHREVRVNSVINAPAWEHAKWLGAAYTKVGRRQLPGIALIFGKKNVAEKIFANWRERFGCTDVNDEIYLTVVRNFPDHDPNHYVMLITSKHTSTSDDNPSQAVTASKVMAPDNDQALKHFLDEIGQSAGEYYLLPAVMTDGVPEMMEELMILKRSITVKDATDVNDREIENLALSRMAKKPSKAT
jgi:hypothetical protein